MSCSRACVVAGKVHRVFCAAALSKRAVMGLMEREGYEEEDGEQDGERGGDGGPGHFYNDNVVVY